MLDKLNEHSVGGRAELHGLGYFTVAWEDGLVGFSLCGKEEILKYTTPLTKPKSKIEIPKHQRQLIDRSMSLIEMVAKSLGYSELHYEVTFCEDREDTEKKGYRFEQPGSVAVKRL